MIKKYTLTFLLTFCALFYGFSQLSAGDIAIVQYNADGTDNFAFVALVDIAGGQVIFFTDNEENTLAGGEGTIEWTAPAGGISCGDIVTITTTPSATVGTVSETNDLNFNAGGDSVLAYTGSAVSPTFIAALSNDGGAWGGGGDGNLPSGLTNGTTAIAINPEIDNCAYNATLTNDTQNNLLGAINNNGNWTLTSDTANQTYAGGTMTVTDCTPGAPNITVSNGSITGLDYSFGAGPSPEDTYTISGSNLTPANGNLTIAPPANFEVSLSSGSGFVANPVTLSVPYTGGSLGVTTIYVRLAAGLAVNTYGPSDILNYGGGVVAGNAEIVSVSGEVTISGASDIIAVPASESATISSLENDPAPLSSTDGTQVWQFDVRDGGGSSDADALATILTDLTIIQSFNNNVTTWTDAIQTVALFDGSTFIATGTVSANQIVFSGMNVVVNDNTNKRLTLRLSLTCPLGADAFDNEDFGFRITSSNTTFSASGSSGTTFDASSAQDENVIDVVSTELRFTTQPVTTGVNTVMSAVVVSATDSCGNIDTDFNGDIGISSSGTMVGDPITVTAVNGSAVFVGLDGIEHTVEENNLILTANSVGYPLVFSSLFDITSITQLERGDLAILAMNTNSSVGRDQIAFVCFKDLLPGTQLFITDNGYERENANLWGGTEGVIRITRTGSTLPKGTTIVIQAINANIRNAADFDIYTCGVVDSNWTKWAQTGTSVGGFNANNDDDIYFMQGGVWTNSTPATDHTSTYTGTVLYGWTESGWDSGPGGASESTAYSTLYPGLECFNTEAPSGGTNTYVKFNDPVDPDFSTLTNGRLDWIALINEPSNWDVYTSDANYDAGGYDYIGNTNCPAMTVDNNIYVDGRWQGTVDTDWFNCNNWETLVVPDENTDVLVDDNPFDREASIDIASPFASYFGNIARTRNLTITDERVELVGGINNKLEVNGDLAINGGELDMDDPSDGGELTLFGDWIRNISAGGGTFSPGNGTVIFSGTTPQDIVFTGAPLPPIQTEQFFNVTLDNNFTTSANNNLYMSGDLIITPTHTLIVSSGDFAHVGNQVINNGTFEIENNGSLVQVNNVANSGNVSVKREIASITNYDYIYWSSPVIDFNVDGIYSGFGSSPLYKYLWDPVATNANGTQGNWIDAAGSDMAVGRGYIVRDPVYGFSPNETVEFNNGAPHNGTVNVQIRRGTNGSIVDDNWNLLGNPYASSIDAIDFLTNNTNIDGFVYLWRHLNNPLTTNPDPFYQDFIYNYDPDDYIAYNSTGVSDPIGFNGYIATGQSFFVSMLETGNATQNVTFDNSLRDIAYDNSQFYSPNPDNNVIFGESSDESSTDYTSKHRIWLDLISSNENVDRIMVGYVEGATIERDRMYDAITTLDNTQNFYSLIDDEIFVIQGRGLPFEETDEIPLGMQIVSPGQYHIGIAHVDGMFESESQSVYLRDHENNFIHNLKESPYNFYSESGRINDRFEIVFTNETLDLDDIQLDIESLIIYEDQDGNFNIRVPENFSIKTVEINDLLGRKVLLSNAISSSFVRLNSSELSQSTYVVTVELDNGTKLVRKVVKRY